METETRTCADCPTDISDTHRNVRRCLPCASKREVEMRKLRQERHRQTNPPPKAAAVRELVDEVRELVSEARADRETVAELTEQVTALINEVSEFRRRVWDHQGSRPPRRMRRLAAAIQGWKSPAAQPHQLMPPVEPTE